MTDNRRTYGHTETYKKKNQTLLNGEIKQNDAPCRATLFDLPSEILDIILQKSYLYWILNASAQLKNEDVIRSLISVDVCFNRRITTQRFKNPIYRYLRDFYGNTKRRRAIIRNNRDYLLYNIQPRYELIAYLLSHKCITEEQSHFIQRQRSTRDKTDELLYVIESLDETNFSNFVKYLQRTNQKTVAKILENGGGVTKVKVQTPRAKCTMSMETQLLHQKIENLGNKMKPRSHQIDKLIVQLREEGLEILNSRQKKQTVVVWIWCRTQAALEHIQKLYESNQLEDIFFKIIHTYIYKPRPTSILMVINIDTKQFKKTVEICPISINFTQRIEVKDKRYYFRGVTKLRNEIYVLFRAYGGYVIRVFEDRISYRLQEEIKIKEIQYSEDIGSCEMEKCLFICDYGEECVWKITRETDKHKQKEEQRTQHKITKWLTTNYKPRSLSVSSDGRLLMINDSSKSLMIYGSDAKLIRSIPLDMIYPRHAVETSIGNFIIIHTEEKKKEMAMEESKHREWSGSRDTQGGSNGRRGEYNMLFVSEFSRDGQMLTRRNIPSDEPRAPNYPGYYLSLDSDDRIFVADRGHDKVILLDPDFTWNRILCSSTEKEEEMRILEPFRLYYDKEMKQLIVGGFDQSGVNVYTLSRN